MRRAITGSSFEARFGRHGVSEANVTRAVPKVLHQTWRTRDLLPVHRRSFASWDRCLGTDWLHVLWTDAEANAFVLRAAPAWFVPTFAAYVDPIHRVDTFRYVLLFKYGGVYADLDNECTAKRGSFALPENRSRCDAFLSETCCGDNLDRQARRQRRSAARLGWPAARALPPPVQNSLMASIPRAPFWSRVLSLAQRRGPEADPFGFWFRRVSYTVGVDVVTDSVLTLGLAHEDGDICFLPRSDWHGDGTHPPSFVFHAGTHSWSSRAIVARGVGVGAVYAFLLGFFLAAFAAAAKEAQRAA